MERHSWSNSVGAAPKIVEKQEVNSGKIRSRMPRTLRFKSPRSSTWAARTAGEFPKLEQVLVGENGFGVSSKAQNIGDNHAVLTVRFGLADVHVSQSVGLHGVDDLDGPAVVNKE